MEGTPKHVALHNTRLLTNAAKRSCSRWIILIGCAVRVQLEAYALVALCVLVWCELMCKGTLNTRWFLWLTNSPTALNVPEHLKNWQWQPTNRQPVLQRQEERTAMTGLTREDENRKRQELCRCTHTPATTVEEDSKSNETNNGTSKSPYPEENITVSVSSVSAFEIYYNFEKSTFRKIQQYVKWNIVLDVWLSFMYPRESCKNTLGISKGLTFGQQLTPHDSTEAQLKNRSRQTGIWWGRRAIRNIHTTNINHKFALNCMRMISKFLLQPPPNVVPLMSPIRF